MIAWIRKDEFGAYGLRPFSCQCDSAEEVDIDAGERLEFPQFWMLINVIRCPEVYGLPTNQNCLCSIGNFCEKLFNVTGIVSRLILARCF